MYLSQLTPPVLSRQSRQSPVRWSHSSARLLQRHGWQFGKPQKPRWHWSQCCPNTFGRHRHCPVDLSQLLSLAPMLSQSHAEVRILDGFIGGSKGRGCTRDAPPLRSIFFNFRTVFWELVKIIGSHQPLRLVSSPLSAAG